MSARSGCSPPWSRTGLVWQADYKMEEIVYELNKVACELAVEAAKEVSGRVRCGEPQLVDEASRTH